MAKKKAKAKKTAKKKVAASSKARTKSQIFGELAESHGVTRKDVASMFDTMADMIKSDLSKKGPGVFNLAGLMKIKVVDKPATKARKGVNPFTGEPMMIKAKPARRAVKVTALKNLKDLVGKR